MSPYTRKQKNLIHAVAHGAKPRVGGMSQEDAKKMEEEMKGQKTRPPVKKGKRK